MATKITTESFVLDPRVVAIRAEREAAQGRFIALTDQVNRVVGRLRYLEAYEPSQPTPESLIERDQTLVQLRADLARLTHERLEAAETLSGFPDADAAVASELARAREHYTDQWRAATSRVDAALTELAAAALGMRSISDQAATAVSEINGTGAVSPFGFVHLKPSLRYWLLGDPWNPAPYHAWRREQIAAGFLPAE